MLVERGERLDEAVDLDPDGRWRSIRGTVRISTVSVGPYFKLRRYEDARTHLAEAASQLPSNSVVQDHLGDALAALGRHADAIGAWQRALAGDREAIDETGIASKIAQAKEQASR